jgi:hypothetical protein
MVEGIIIDRSMMVVMMMMIQDFTAPTAFLVRRIHDDEQLETTTGFDVILCFILCRVHSLVQKPK